MSKKRTADPTEESTPAPVATAVLPQEPLPLDEAATTGKSRNSRKDKQRTTEEQTAHLNPGMSHHLCNLHTRAMLTFTEPAQQPLLVPMDHSLRLLCELRADPA